MAGYSKTPLARKLGIKAGAKVWLINASPAFLSLLEPLPARVAIRRNRPAARCDVIVLFVDDRSTLTRRMAETARRLGQAGGLWIAWPKRDSGMQTNLTEDIVRAIGLDGGLVDNKVCAIDDTWSGLRFVVRLKDRQRPNARSKTLPSDQSGSR